MIDVQSVHKFYGPVHAVRGVSFSVAVGEIVGLLGHNGAGKTTTIRMIAGYASPDVGTVRLGGLDSAVDRAKAMRTLGYLPEHNPLYPEMRVREYLHFRGALFGMPRAAARTASERVADRCRLREVITQRVGTLSKGFRQRVGLAAALLHDPKVLLLDEPTNGLDPSQIQETRLLIRELGEERTMLISSHILGEIEKLCKRAIIFSHGTVRADRSIAGLLEQDSGLPPRVRLRAAGDHAAVRLFEHALAQWSPPLRAHTAPAAPGTHAWECVATDREGGADAFAGKLADAAKRAGLRIVELGATTPTLESAFLKLMEEPGDDGKGAA